MKAHCFGCNLEKDSEILEVSPFADEDGLTNEPIEPLLILDCQGPQIPNDPNHYSEFRQVVVCHSCFHKLSPDMWISKSCWESISPYIPYEKLPLFVSGQHNPTQIKPLP